MYSKLPLKCKNLMVTEFKRPMSTGSMSPSPDASAPLLNEWEVPAPIPPCEAFIEIIRVKLRRICF